MRTFADLDFHEKGDAIGHCNYLVLELLYDGMVLMDEGALNEKVNQALEESETLSDFVVSPIIVEDDEVASFIDDMAEAMAMDAEYPSRNEDGTYKKVIQL